MNKAIAGYHLLMILSAVDHQFNRKEDLVIKNYLIESFPTRTDLDQEMEVLSAMDPSDYPIHFNKMMDEFYKDSTPEDRTHFLDFAVKLVAADKVVSPAENSFLNELFNGWDSNYS